MNILEKIVEARKIDIAVAKKRNPYSSLIRTASPPRVMFSNTAPFTIIAESKKGSPSRGIFLNEYNPVELATSYEAGGAGAISVLTEPTFFFGADSHLVDVRASVGIPVLRKEFMVDPYQVREAWGLGADAILLIATILDKNQIIELTHAAHENGLQVLFEIHGEDELEKAFVAPVDAVGINARNLKDFSIDIEAIKSLCKKLPENAVRVAESGLKTPADAVAMYEAGFRAFLIGETFVTAPDRTASVRSFFDGLTMVSRT